MIILCNIFAKMCNAKIYKNTYIRLLTLFKNFNNISEKDELFNVLFYS